MKVAAGFLMSNSLRSMFFSRWSSAGDAKPAEILQPNNGMVNGWYEAPALPSTLHTESVFNGIMSVPLIAFYIIKPCLGWRRITEKQTKREQKVILE